MAAAAATAATKGNGGGGGGGRAGAGEASGTRKKKGPGPLATAYLVILLYPSLAGEGGLRPAASRAATAGGVRNRHRGAESGQELSRHRCLPSSARLRRGPSQVDRHRGAGDAGSSGARGRLPRRGSGGPWRTGGLATGAGMGGGVPDRPAAQRTAQAASHERWLVIAVGLVRAYLATGSYHSLYYSIEKPLKFFQTGALLEILHCAIGIVPSSVVLTSFQVMSRVFLIWAVTHSVKEVQSEDSVLLFVIAWTITEIIRYSFYTFSLLNHLPYLIKWARYTLFIVLYPMGVSGELLTIYAALPFVRQASLYSISLPNKYNFSFDYYAFLILIMISYIPIFPQLYFHMIHQRRKILSYTEEHKKFE
ncbi:PREDICTED: very-long-chain (3R)-3-hydroxyacyl-[acyl-carrier protein] dehydratase 2 [Galeopterus variegatus]|uniref:Very-long-chain (3R)-3-hydroxyacyl-CoA dehydratase n=1 Tax=Galeopterus variegatus TaxID=482537 RepID=A0ABM0QJW0_GALVR|nr:PREDICTED: very-long-chain (3R)-3-hydroxyacyl-[acyl-carrier protein] dehydratase 2 [Galeopterus variegatus]